MTTEPIIRTRVEKHTIKTSDEHFAVLSDFCHKAKNLYNHANYPIRQAMTDTDNKRWIRYAELDKILKADKEYPDYQDMPTAQLEQQVLRLIDKNWKAFFRL